MNTANSSDTVRVCEICGEDYKPAGWAQRRHDCVKCVRGLLCHSCNQQFIAAVESNVRLRDLVSPRVVAYIDSKRETGIGSST